MALVVEDGTGKANAESYISVTDANTYHTSQGNAAWTGSDTVKEQALRKATAYLDNKYRHRWPGTRANETQALAWPREGASDADGYAIDSDAVPACVPNACAEAGLRALTVTLQPDEKRGGAVRRKKVGPLEQEYEPNAPPGTTYTFVTSLLSPVLSPANRMLR